jgi:hypothetical protein
MHQFRFVDVFRRELLRVLNRGEAVNALKRVIYTSASPVIRPNSPRRCRLLPMP